MERKNKNLTKSEIIKLRNLTGAGIMDAKRALQQAKGDFNKAVEIIKAQGLELAKKKSQRQAKQGLIECYVHCRGAIGVICEINCETDFVAKNKEFKELAHEIAMQIAAMAPKNVDELLKSSYIRDEKITIADLIRGKVTRFGENIKITRFVRYKLGE